MQSRGATHTLQLQTCLPAWIQEHGNRSTRRLLIVKQSYTLEGIDKHDAAERYSNCKPLRSTSRNARDKGLPSSLCELQQYEKTFKREKMLSRRMLFLRSVREDRDEGGNVRT